MEVQTLLTEEKVNQDNEVHLTFEDQPFLAFCGVRLQGVDATEPMTCKACESIDKLLDEMDW